MTKDLMMRYGRQAVQNKRLAVAAYNGAIMGRGYLNGQEIYNTDAPIGTVKIEPREADSDWWQWALLIVSSTYTLNEDFKVELDIGGNIYVLVRASGQSRATAPFLPEGDPRRVMECLVRYGDDNRMHAYINAEGASNWLLGATVKARVWCKNEFWPYGTGITVGAVNAKSIRLDNMRTSSTQQTASYEILAPYIKGGTVGIYGDCKLVSLPSGATLYSGKLTARGDDGMPRPFTVTEDKPAGDKTIRIDITSAAVEKPNFPSMPYEAEMYYHPPDVQGQEITLECTEAEVVTDSRLIIQQGGTKASIVLQNVLDTLIANGAADDCYARIRHAGKDYWLVSKPPGAEGEVIQYNNSTYVVTFPGGSDFRQGESVLIDVCRYEVRTALMPNLPRALGYGYEATAASVRKGILPGHVEYEYSGSYTVPSEVELKFSNNEVAVSDGGWPDKLITDAICPDWDASYETSWEYSTYCSDGQFTYRVKLPSREWTGNAISTTIRINKFDLVEHPIKMTLRAFFTK